MRINTTPNFNFYHNNNISTNNSYIKNQNPNINFKGKTNFYAMTDIHQNAEKHCKMIWEILKNPDISKTVILDNGDIFKGLFPKYTLMHTYARAKKFSPELEIVYNVGNNDPGFTEIDRYLFDKYLNILHQSGIKTISANLIDETTGLTPKGIKPYAIIERDGDKLMYVGFVINKLKHNAGGIITTDPIETLEKITPKLKNEMEKNQCKGLVFMVHDSEDSALKLSKKAEELGLQPDFVIGGHVHQPHFNKEFFHIYPEPFGKSMINFDLNIKDNKHRIANFNEIFSENCDLGVFSQLINKAKKNEKFDEPIAKSVTRLKHRYQTEYDMKFSQLGTFYADGIKDITKSDVGFVPKSWMYDSLSKKNGNIVKLDILTSFPRPFKRITQVTMKPDELKAFHQYEITKKGKLYDASNNFELTINKNNEITQIHIDGKPLFNPDGTAINPDKEYKVALNAHTAEKLDYPQKESRKTMYDGIVHGLKRIEKEFLPNEEYPITKLIIEG